MPRNLIDYFLKLSGIGFGYSLSKARVFAEHVRGFLSSEEIMSAVMEAENDQMERGEPGRIQLFIPCNSDEFPPEHFQEDLIEPIKYKLAKGENSVKGIYGRRNDAYLGHIIDNSQGFKADGRPHLAFLIYDPNAKAIVDYIGRDGRSIMNPTERIRYLSTLEEELNDSVAWVERPLADN